MLLPIDDRRFIADPYPTLNAFRETGPIHWDDDLKLWFITRHSDVKAAQLDRRLGSVQNGYAEPGHFRPIRELDLDDWEAYYATERHSLLMLEPPEHTRIRRLVSRAFTPRRVSELRQPITAIARDLLDDLEGRAGFDLLADFAQPYSIRVIATLLGAPVDEGDLLLEWSHAIVKMYEITTTKAQALAAIEAAKAFTDWAMHLMKARRAAPQEDLITALCYAETDDGVLTDAEIVSTIILLLNAGHEATVNTMGNGFAAIAQHSAAGWAALAQGRVPAATAIEEMIRYDPPLQMFERYVLADSVEIAEKTIPKGDKVAMLLGSANRDPRAFDDPDSFRLDRGDAGHVTFGAGVHYCLGAPLARLELDVAVSELARKMPSLHLEQAPLREDGFSIHGYESVAVAV